MSIEFGPKNVETVGELIEKLVAYIEDNPDSAALPVAVLNMPDGLVRPITTLTDEDVGLLIYTNDEYHEVHKSFRTIPGPFNLVGQINRLFERFFTMMKEPRNSKLVWGLHQNERGEARVMLRRQTNPKLSGLKDLALDLKTDDRGIQLNE